MPDEDPSVPVFHRPQNQSIWLVRAEGGAFVPHFRVSSSVAIGHLDKIRIGESRDIPFAPENGLLRTAMASAYRRPDGSMSSKFAGHYGQVSRFLFEAKVGDLVVTPESARSGRVHIGRVIGKPRLDRRAIEVVNEISIERSSMPFALRRRVAWGPVLKKSDLADNLQKALRAQQSVSRLDVHWDAIYHHMYPIFVNNDELRMSINIKTDKPINNVDISKLFVFLSEVELFASCEKDSLIEIFESDNLDLRFMELLRFGDLSLVSRSKFQSPGTVWSYLKGKKNSWIKIYLVYSLLFGNDHLGVDGVIDLEIRQKLANIMIESFIDTRDRLELDNPQHDTHVLEDSTSDEE